MIRKASLFLTALSCCASAWAADLRIKTLKYDPHQIVRVSGQAGFQSTIEFAPDERIENVALGNSAEWQVTPNRRASLIFLKPLVTRSRSNMTVVTDRRIYMFDLVTSARGVSPIYALRFSYPANGIRSAERAGITAEPATVPAAAPPTPIRPQEFNFAWTSKGASNLLPARVFDDGSAVYLAWRRDVPLPAIMTMSDDRKVAALNYRVDGDYLVVSPVPSNIVLRYANKQASIWPSGPTRAVRGARPVAPPAVEPATESSPMIALAPAPSLSPPATVLSSASPSKKVRVRVREQQKLASAEAARLAYSNFLINDDLTDAEHAK
jgi:type IV secretion system protein VirB9